MGVKWFQIIVWITLWEISGNDSSFDLQNILSKKEDFNQRMSLKFWIKFNFNWFADLDLILF